MTEVGSK